MVTEDYVSFETAKLLKEKGFDWEVHRSYLMNDNVFIPGDINDVPLRKDAIRIPTLQMVMKWIEEKYGVFCVIRRHGNKDDGFIYSWNCEGKMGLSVGNGGGFKTAAGACEAAIKYCLESLI